MPQAPNLLNDDKSVSMATMLLMSHHAFRRDIRRFIRAIEQVKAGDVSRNEALRAEWQMYRGALHGHHSMEDANIFPDIKRKRAGLDAVIDRLTEDHHHIDPLLDRGDEAFGKEIDSIKAAPVLEELKKLLDDHLAREEEEVTPFLREVKHFPTPSTDAEAEMYANGFSWSMQGIAPEVLDEVCKFLPENLVSRLPAAQKAFDERCERAWGSAAVGLSKTSIPEGYV